MITIKTIANKIITFLLGFFREMTGQPSSKRLIAFGGFLLIAAIVKTYLYIIVYAVEHAIKLAPEIVDLMHFLGAVILGSLIAFVLTILGFNLSQNKAAIAAQTQNIASLQNAIPIPGPVSTQTGTTNDPSPTDSIAQ